MDENSSLNPDEILADIKRREEKEKKGKLKIYLGMCAGVGKTFSMLQDASKAKGKGIDVVIGYVETHGRSDTEFLLFYLEQIPRKKLNYKGIVLEEMDLDFILERKPKLVIVDELAHTNAPGSRHLKRYLDVIELLNAGIDVYTAVNVQHIESRTDFVSRITGIIIKESVPDSILDIADEIELVDISPDELLQRLSDGKVYTKDKSGKAIDNFFRKGNLTALREISLRMTAERVDRQLRDYMLEKRIQGPWKPGHRILIGISPSPSSVQLIRWARKVSYSLEASLVAVNVETSKRLTDDEKKMLHDNIELAKELGAEFINTSDEDVVKAILRTARKENVTDIIIGKSRTRNLHSFFRKDIVSRLIYESGNIDIYVVSEDSIQERKIKFSLPKPKSGLLNYSISALIILLASILLYSVKDYIGHQSIAFILLFIVSLLPLYFGPGPVLLASLMSPLIWNFFFVRPQFTFMISKTEDVLVFFLFLLIAAVTGTLTTKIRGRETLLRKREENALALYKLSSDLSNALNIKEVENAFILNIQKVFSAEAVLLTPDNKGKLTDSTGKHILSGKENSVAQWVYSNEKKAGKYTDTLPDSNMMYLPVKSPTAIYGILGIKLSKNEISVDESGFLDIFVNQLASAMERETLKKNAARSRIVEESEKLYKNLFDSISHELKTPISAIIGSASLLLDKNSVISEENIRKLIEEIQTGGLRLNQLVENLLNMTRLETGHISLKPDWCDVNDLFNSVLNKIGSQVEGCSISKTIPENMPLIFVDTGLFEQAIGNIILNSIKYTKPGTEITLKSEFDDNFCYFYLTDKGEGIPEEQLDKIFEKFYRIDKSMTGGTGLGLSIAKGFVELHGGTIKAVNIPSGGAQFIIKLPRKSSEEKARKI
jgi:two-component system, OmpR family, sensor histidine kinase KdpD